MTAGSTFAGAARGASKLNVFISYSRQDMAFVDRLQAALAARSIEAFVDRGHIEKGEAWWTRIKQLISEADTIVFVLSPGSVTSEVCKDEVEFAERLNKRFMPIVARDLEGHAVPAALARLNYIFFVPHPESGTIGDFERALDELARALQTDIAWIREHTRLSAMSLRWEARGRPADILLRGAELAAAERWLVSRPVKAPDPTDAHRAFVAASRSSATRRQRYWVAGSFSVALVALGLAGVAYFKSIEAEQSATRAMKARDLALITQSKYLAPIAVLKTVEGDAVTAALAALEGLPDKEAHDINARTRPVWPEASVALKNALRTQNEYRVVGGRGSAVPRFYLEESDRLVWDQPFGGAWVAEAETGREVVNLAEPGRAVNHLALSPDEKSLLACQSDGVCSLWDLDALRRVHRLDAEATDQNEKFYMLYSSAFSDDGKLLAIGNDKSLFRVFDTQTGQVVLRNDHARVIGGLAFSPDGTKILSEGPDDTTIAWDLRDGTQQTVATGGFGIDQGFIFAAGGRVLILHDSKQSVRFLDTQSWQELASVRTRAGAVSVVALSPDQALLAVGSETGDLRLYREQKDGSGKASWKLVANLDGHSKKIIAAAFSADSTTLSTSSNDGTVRVWNTADGRPRVQLQGNQGDVSRIEYARSGNSIVTFADDGTARWWAIGGPRVLAGTLDFKTVSYRGNDDSDGGSQIVSMEFSGDGRQLLSRGINGTTVVWDYSTGLANPRRLETTAYISAAKFLDASGKRIVAASKENGIEIWDATKAARIKSLATFDLAVRSIDVSPDRRSILICFDNGRVEVLQLNAESDAVEAQRHLLDPRGQNEPVFLDAFAKFLDGDRVLVGRANDRALVLSLRTGETLREIPMDGGSIYVASASPDGRYLVTSQKGRSASLVDLQTGTELKKFQFADIITKAIFAPDSRSVALQPRIGPAELWSLDAAKGPAKVAVFASSLLAFSSDGSQLLTETGDPFEGSEFTCTLWDIADRAPVVRLLSHAGVFNVGHVLSRDGKILTGHEDGSITLWAAMPRDQHLVQTAKERLPRCLTAQQRKDLYLPDAPPRWCVTGAGLEAEGDPAKWQPKWPYQSQTWNNWAIARERDENAPLPQTQTE